MPNPAVHRTAKTWWFPLPVTLSFAPHIEGEEGEKVFEDKIENVLERMLKNWGQALNCDNENSRVRS